MPKMRSKPAKSITRDSVDDPQLRHIKPSSIVPTRPVTAISFSVGSSVLRVPPSELALLRFTICGGDNARRLTRDTLGNALARLRLTDRGFADAVFQLSDLRGCKSVSPRHVLHAYAALRALAIVRAPVVKQRAIEELLWLVFQSASGGRGATRVRWSIWEAFVGKIGSAIGGSRSIPKDHLAIRRLRSTWRKYSSVSDVCIGAVSYETIVRMSQKYDAGLIEALCALGFVWTHSVVRSCLTEHEGTRLPVWRNELNSQFVSSYLAREIQTSEYIMDPNSLPRQGSIDGEDDESFMSKSFLSLRQFGNSFRSTASSKQFTIDFQEDIRFPQTETKSYSTLPKTGLVKRTKNTRSGKSPFNINFSSLTIGERIGSGGYGEVYQATFLMSPVAVKIFDLQLPDTINITNDTKQTKEETVDESKDQEDPNILNRSSTRCALEKFATTSSSTKYDNFIKEVEMMSMVRHPNLVLYMGVCANLSTPLCIVSELFTGGSLYEYLHNDSNFKPSIEIGIDFALNIARGMYYLHSSQPAILHRDLKSRNVLLSGRNSNGAAPHIVICDFGLSQLFDDNDNRLEKKKIDPELAASGKSNGMEQMGTASYMSPNFIDGENFEALDDVYSFGILLHEIFTGCIPYNGMRAMQVLYQVSFNDLRPSCKYDDTLPSSITKLIADCWHKDKLRRPLFDKIIKRLLDIQSEINKMENAH